MSRLPLALTSKGGSTIQEAVRAFAGPDYTIPVFDPEARQLLSKVEPLARHYEVKTHTVVEPGD